MLVHVFYMSCWFMFLTCHISSCVLNITFVHDSSCHVNTHNMFITCCFIKNSYRSLNICAVLFVLSTLPGQTKVRGLKGREMCFARFSCVEKIAVGQFGGSHGTSWFHLFLLTFGQKNNQSRSGVFLMIWLYQGVLGMRCPSGSRWFDSNETPVFNAMI